MKCLVNIYSSVIIYYLYLENGKMDTSPKDSMLSQKEKKWLVKKRKISQAIFLGYSILIFEKIC